MVGEWVWVFRGSFDYSLVLHCFTLLSTQTHHPHKHTSTLGETVEERDSGVGFRLVFLYSIIFLLHGRAGVLEACLSMGVLLYRAACALYLSNIFLPLVAMIWYHVFVLLAFLAFSYITPLSYISLGFWFLFAAACFTDNGFFYTKVGKWRIKFIPIHSTLPFTWVPWTILRTW